MENRGRGSVIEGDAGSADRVGTLLREWRGARRLSQLDLSFRAKVSSRHISYVETGKAQPSRGMVVRLSNALDMPLRERNRLLLAAGYAPEYPESELGAARLTSVEYAIDSLLERQEPYPAFVLNRRWDILRTNAAADRVAVFLDPPRSHTNMVLQFVDPDALRSLVPNWEEIAHDLIGHLQDEVAAVPSDAASRALLDEALAFPGVPSPWRTRELDQPPSPVLTVEFRKDDRRLRFFSTITTFGTARDVTLDELRIESAFPADQATAELCRELADEPGSA